MLARFECNIIVVRLTWLAAVVCESELNPLTATGTVGFNAGHADGSKAFNSAAAAVVAWCTTYGTKPWARPQKT